MNIWLHTQKEDELCVLKKHDFEKLLVLKSELENIFRKTLELCSGKINLQKVKSQEKIEDTRSYRGLVKQRKKDLILSIITDLESIQ